MSVAGLLTVLVLAGEPVGLSHVVFSTGQVEPWSEASRERESTPPVIGEQGGPVLVLPTEPPQLPARGSRFSTLHRARDVLDIARHPARSVVKLFRLDGAGARQGSACTAQFVGPRHLVTAAHCIIDRRAGRPHEGFEISLAHDGGSDEGVLPVVAAWAPTSEFQPRATVVTANAAFDPTDPLNVGSDCRDIALIEVAEPVGAAAGWLGMSATADDGILHRFSYPHQSSADILAVELARADHPPAVRARLTEEIDRRRQTEPDFSPDNLYYDYGPADRIQDAAVSELTGAVLPGRSGSALIDDEGRVVAVMSRAALGVNASCRLTPSLIGTFATIAGLPAG